MRGSNTTVLLLGIATACGGSTDSPGELDGGAGSGGGGSACTEPSVTLVAAQDSPQAIAIDAAFLYWTNRASDSSTETGTVMALAHGDSAPKILADKQGQPWRLLPLGNYVYFIDIGLNIYYGTLMRVPTSGGAPSTIVPEPVNALVADASWLYVAVGDSVHRMSFAGSNDSVIGSHPQGVVSLAIDNVNIYFSANPTVSGSNFNHDGLVAKLPKTGGAPTVLASGQLLPDDVQVENGFVYWTEQGLSHDGTVRRVALDGSSLTTIAQGLANPHSAHIDETNVYWANLGSLEMQYTDGSVMKAPKGGGSAKTIASQLNGPEALAIDDKYVYWVERGTYGMKNGKVMRACK